MRVFFLLTQVQETCIVHTYVPLGTSLIYLRTQTILGPIGTTVGKYSAPPPYKMQGFNFGCSSFIFK